MTDPAEQLSAGEVAELLGITRASFYTYRTRPGALPSPDGWLGTTPWWYRSSIEAWAQTSRRRPGRPAGGDTRP